MKTTPRFTPTRSRLSVKKLVWDAFVKCYVWPGMKWLIWLSFVGQWRLTFYLFHLLEILDQYIKPFPRLLGTAIFASLAFFNGKDLGNYLEPGTAPPQLIARFGLGFCICLLSSGGHICWLLRTATIRGDSAAYFVIKALISSISVRMVISSLRVLCPFMIYLGCIATNPGQGMKMAFYVSGWTSGLVLVIWLSSSGVAIERHVAIWERNRLIRPQRKHASQTKVLKQRPKLEQVDMNIDLEANILL
ncbi:hypothetical protein K491DRAFT_502567 [Lophiostoma macrostomum CBS 122681]|uniref:Uncharacterized protein n=1 Tax=Lophiostoma macrostomum CBS 122681 TaxID=1314788 RepID=A0A6A6T3R9_9PLEO|nr:hypothetical protein K491DRAFT_502567 [Lophiostoma macrostomum CBS 122681]